ncbi:MAG: hypothetical protein R3212_10740, partial [Xanthomonadales bacterium]|nr:hypothetical protein [Xanthomonadales bacterium]
MSRMATSHPGLTRTVYRRLAIACIGLLLCPAALAQGVRVTIELPEDERQVVRHETVTFESLHFPRFLNPTSLYVDVHGKAPFLVEVAVGGPSCTPALQFEEVGFDAVHPEYPLHRPTFSRLYTEDSEPGALFGHRMALPLEFVDGRRAETMEDPDAVPSTYDGEWLRNVPENWACEVAVRVTREPVCAMWAQVTGDVQHTADGGVAYFNTFEGGVPITTGTIADEGMHEELEGFLAMAEGMMQLAEEMGYDVPDPERESDPLEGTPSTSEAVQQMRDEMFAEGGDTFGLTLTDVNTEAAAEQPEGEGAALMELAQGIGVLAGSFTLEASAPGGVEFLEHEDHSMDLDSGAGSIITVPLSLLRVVPGGLDGNLNRVPFVYDGEQGSGILIVTEFDKD